MWVKTDLRHSEQAAKGILKLPYKDSSIPPLAVESGTWFLCCVQSMFAHVTPSFTSTPCSWVSHSASCSWHLLQGTSGHLVGPWTKGGGWGQIHELDQAHFAVSFPDLCKSILVSSCAVFTPQVLWLFALSFHNEQYQRNLIHTCGSQMLPQWKRLQYSCVCLL